VRSAREEAGLILFRFSDGYSALTTAEKLLAITYKGYALKDGDIRGIRADRAKKLLISYLLGASISRDEKAAVAAACGYTVKNGKISLK